MSWRYLSTYLNLIILITISYYVYCNISFNPIVLCFKTVISLSLLVAFALLTLIWFLSANSQHNKIKLLQITKRKERAQILYQIAMINKDTDTKKLNEWIYNYNQWIVQILADKKVKGYFSYYQPLNMGEHAFIVFA